MTWLHTFKMKDLLNEHDVSPEEAISKARIVANRLEESPFKNKEYLIGLFLEVTDLNSLNKALDRLYDAADIQRIWVE